MKDLTRIRQVFLDMDGTIYHGTELFPTTLPFLAFLDAHGIGYSFLSNNSSYGHEDYIRRLAKFGITVRADQFYISTDYAIDFLKRNHPEIKRIFCLGMPCMAEMFAAAGFVMEEETPQAVIVGFDRMLTYDRLCRAAWFLRNGVPGFATHPDVYCPTDSPTWLVDCGAITACLEKATNTKLRVLGKPDPGMLIEAAARKNTPVENVLMIGDRLSTDISLGVNAGAMTCHIQFEGADLIIPEGIVPDFDLPHLGALQALWEQQL